MGGERGGKSPEITTSTFTLADRIYALADWSPDPKHEVDSSNTPHSHLPVENSDFLLCSFNYTTIVTFVFLATSPLNHRDKVLVYRTHCFSQEKY
jgi:hypothetical protein